MSMPPIPSVGNIALETYLRALTNELDRRLRDKISQAAGVDSILLVSPGRKVYSVQVADDGTLSTTLVAS